MTDTARVNNVYYDMNVYNATSTPIKAQIDNKLLFPLLNQADQYSVSLAKAKVPLDSIPLTRSNLPLKLYQLGLKIGTTEELAYIRQVNANQDNFVWNCPKGSTIITKYKYTSAGVLTEISNQNIGLLVPVVYNFVVDDYSNLFVAGSDTLSEVPNKVYVISPSNILLQTLEYVHIKHIYIDRGQNLYVCDEAPSPLVYVYGMLNAEEQVNITQKTTLTTNKAGNPLVNLLFCVADGEIIVGYNQNTITLYNDQYEPQTDITETAITQLQNLANINATANTYVLANSNEIDDTIYGVQNQAVYNVNDNTQFTTGNIISQLAITNPTNGYGFAIGTDNHTYAISYPPASLPANYFQANGSNSLNAGCLWSSQKSAWLYGTGLSHLYYVWNFNCSRDISPLNSWSEVGEIQLGTGGTAPTPLNIDVQSTTDKLLVVGTDNNLYISQDPVPQIEFIFANYENDQDSQMLGLSYWDSTGNQKNFVERDLGTLFYNVNFFKQGNRYFVSKYNNITSASDLTIYSSIDFSVLSTHPSFDSNMNSMTYFHLASKFGYENNNNEIKICDVSTLATIYTISEPPNLAAQQMYELDATHIAVNYTYAYSSWIYIYNFADLANPVIINFSNYVCDIAVNKNDITNGAPSLFFVLQTVQDNISVGQEIYKMTFGDNTYSTNTQTLIYTTVNNRVITFLEVHQNTGQLIFLDCIYNTNTVTVTNLVCNTLFQNGGYSVNGQVKSTLPSQYNGTPYYLPNKYFNVYLNQSLTATHRWTQVTSNEQIKAISVSRSNPNKFYALGSTDSLIYTGNFLNNAVTFTQYAEFTQTYDYLSNTPNTNPTIQSKLYLYGLQSQNLITSLDLDDECGAIARNDVTNQYMVSQRIQNKVQALNAETLASEFTSTLTGAYRIFTKNGSDIDAGKVDIYNISVLVEGINNAFIEATTKINQALGAGTISSAPSLSLNYQTGLCTLTYPSVFTQSANGILFNQPLLNVVYYQSTLDQQSGLYQLVLNPQQESITQNVKTINKFNQLDKILFRSNSIYVVGAYFGLNDSNNIFFDIDCPTSDWIENLDQTIYFQPNFLRTYFLRSNLSLDDIQLQLYYQYKDGTAYELYINNGENVTVKLQFIQKF